MNYMLTWERDFFSYADSTKTTIINKDNVIGNGMIDWLMNVGNSESR